MPPSSSPCKIKKTAGKLFSRGSLPYHEHAKPVWTDRLIRKDVIDKGRSSTKHEDLDVRTISAKNKGGVSHTAALGSARKPIDVHREVNNPNYAQSLSKRNHG
jgi:hypothetical protein